MKTLNVKILLLLAAVCISSVGWGQISIANLSPVTENFNSLGGLATATLPSNWRMSLAGAGTTGGWVAGVTAVTQQASSGSPGTGGRYNWGDGTTTTNRAIGFMTSGGYASPNSIMSFYQNNTGAIINDVAISFDYRRFRVNTAAASLTFFTSTDGSTWTSRTAGNESGTPLTNTGASAYNFITSTISSKSFTLSGVNIPSSGSFYLRWNFNTTGSNSQGLGLDNVSLTATATSPSAVTPTRLSITNINSGSQVYRNTSFNVTVQAQDGSGSPGNVSGNTVVTLAVGTGTGAVIGTGTITGGTNSVIIPTTYNTVESNVVLIANRTSGDVLSSGTSTSFSVIYPILLSETFGAGTPGVACDPISQNNTGALPAGWANSTGGPGVSPCGNWGLVNNSNSSGYTGSSGAGNLCINNYTTTSTLAVMSPSINATGASGIGIQYASRGTSTFSQTVNCYWSIDNGVTWNLIYGDNNTTGAWRLNPLFVLPAAADGASNLKFKWETAQNNTTSGNYRIDDISVTQGNPSVLPTQISITGFNSLNTIVNPQANYTFGVRFQLFDASGNLRAVTTSSNFTISKIGGSGVLTGTTSITLAPGAFQGDFTGLSYNTVESGITFRITQTSGDILPVANRSGISILGLSETIVPQNINGINELSGYFPTYLGLSGLAANTTYNYYYTILNNTTDISVGFPGFTGSSYGGGNMIASNGSTLTRFSSISVASTTSATFTTDGSGNYSGWFISESGTGSTRVSPGQDVSFRLTLNNGLGSANTPANVFTTTQSARARALTTSVNASSGTELYGNSLGTAKNIVLVWDNVAGTGRPIAGTFLEDAGITYSGSDVVYSTLVDGVDKAWSTIIPNNNANGVRRIAQYSLSTGALIYANTSTGTVWNSFETANPTGGTTTPIYLPEGVAPLTNASFLSSTGTFSQFSAAPGGTSAAQTITVTGALLTGTSTASVSSSNFELSTNGSTYGTNITLSSLTPSFTQVLYVRFKPASSGSFTDVVTLATPGASSLTLTVSGATSANYTWNLPAGGDWQVAANWTPARNTPSSADRLTMSGVNGSITNIPTQTIDALSITNSNVTFNASGTNTLTIGQTAGTDFVVNASSILTLGSVNRLTIALASLNEGSVFGIVTTTGAAHVLTASSSTYPITFYSGAVAGQGGGTMFSGTSVIVFASGSSMVINSGANPFTSATFNPASSLIYTANTGFSTTGRVFPTLVVKSGVSLSSTAPNSIASLVVEPSASLTFTGAPSTTLTGVTTIAGTFNWTSTGALVNNGTFNSNNSSSSSYSIANLTNNGTFNVFGNILTVSGTLLNTGTINIGNNGSLLQGSTAANSGGTYNISRTASNVNDWSFYSSPVSAAPLSNLGNSNYYAFDETKGESYTNGWVGAPSTLVVGKGYLAFPNRVTFTGIANNGTIPTSVSLTGAFSTATGWNLLGNPYPSSIRASSFLSANSAVIAGGTLYLWQNNQYLPYITAGSEQIGSGQAFFVQVQGGGSVSFNNTMRGTSNSTFFRTEGDASPYVRVRLSSGSDWQDAIVGFDANATDGYDVNYDGGLMNGNSNISFYSEAAGRKLTTQALESPISGSKVVPLYYTSTKGGSFDIKLQNYYNPDPSLSVTLKDKTTGAETDLTTTTVVSAVLTKGSDINRFDLVFRQAAVTGSSDNVINGSLNVYTSNETLNVAFTNPSSSTADVYVFNTLGTEILKSNNVSTVGTKSFATSNLNKGVYIVKVGFANGKVENRKIVIE